LGGNVLSRASKTTLAGVAAFVLAMGSAAGTALASHGGDDPPGHHHHHHHGEDHHHHHHHGGDDGYRHG
jgi:hypothetical protein